MHHKYVVRDRKSVWTGSTNWTDDSWSRQENVIVTVDSAELAARFREELRRALVDRASSRRAALSTRTRSTWWAPGSALVHARSRRGALAADRDRDRLRPAPGSDLLSGPQRGADSRDAGAAGLRRAASTSPGASTGPRSRAWIHEWHRNGNFTWKLPLLERVLTGQFSGKPSTPYGSGHACTTSCTRR